MIGQTLVADVIQTLNSYINTKHNSYLKKVLTKSQELTIKGLWSSQSEHKTAYCKYTSGSKNWTSSHNTTTN